MIGGLVASLVGSAWARATLRYVVTVFAILLFLLTLRRSGERVGRLAERLETREKVNEVQRTMLEAAARGPRNRDELVDRLRDGGF
jgi:predicted PurR-regulated permease PerM